MATIPPNPLRKYFKFAAIAFTIALVATVVVVILTTIDQCDDGVEEHGPRNECVGVTDGAFIFAEELRAVEEKIHAENEWVLRQAKEYVNIAYFVPMTLIDNDVTNYAAVRHELAGAYISQRRANHTSEWNGEKPLIRLLLANPGSQAQQWQPVVERIVNGQTATDKVSAVAGLGQSIGGTPNAAKELSKHGIVMVGSIITADHFGDIDHLARVVPTNTDEVNAIVEHLQRNNSQRAMLVRDTNPGDTFAANIGNLFATLYPKDGRTLLTPIEEFVSSDAQNNDFQRIAPEICVANPDAIFFAGRFRDLVRFLDVLARRPCQERGLRVITGDTVVDLTNDEQVRKNLGANILLEYLHLADRHSWSSEAGRTLFLAKATNYFTDPNTSSSFPAEFPKESLDDGLAILAFDAVGTAVTAVREGSDLTRLHGQSAIPGASGWISLDSGNPDRKAMSLLTLSATPGASSTAVTRTVTSCTGTPFRPRQQDEPDHAPCPKPSG